MTNIFFLLFSSGSNLLHITGTFRFSVEFMQNLDDRVIREFRIRNTCFVLQFWACGTAGTFRDAHFSWNLWKQSSYNASSSDRDHVNFCGATINFRDGDGLITVKNFIVEKRPDLSCQGLITYIFKKCKFSRTISLFCFSRAHLSKEAQ